MKISREPVVDNYGSGEVTIPYYQNCRLM